MPAQVVSICLCALLVFLCGPARGAEPVPDCRIDAALTAVFQQTTEKVLTQYRAAGMALPFKRYKVNPSTPVAPDTLAIYVVKDALLAAVDRDGCFLKVRPAGFPELDGPCVPTTLVKCTRSQLNEMRSRAEQMERFGQAGACYLTNMHACLPEERRFLKKQARDPLTVTGGCAVIQYDSPPVIHCSAGAAKILLTETASASVPTAALMFVIAHEITHIRQGAEGAFYGGAGLVDLSLPAERKLRLVSNQCLRAATSGEREQEADEAALKLIEAALPGMNKELPPGLSRLYHVDQMGYAASYMAQWSGFWGDSIKGILHPVHRRMNLNSVADVAQRARQFVCDVARPGRGTVVFPMAQGSHPGLARRISLISSKLAANPALAAPTSDPMADLQTTISLTLANVDQRTSRYQLEIQKAICLASEQMPLSCPEQNQPPDDPSNTLLHVAAMRGDADFVRQLVLGGADVDALNAKSSTPLFFAALPGSLEIAKMLVEANASPDTMNAAKITPLCAAIFAGGQALLESSMQPSKKHDELAEYLIQKSAAPNQKCMPNQTPPIHMAALYGMPQTVKALLGNGADINASDQSGNRPLWYAVSGANASMTTWLIAHGADVAATDSDGDTALHLAASLGNEAVLEVLLKGKADPFKKNMGGESAVDIACKAGKTALGAVLKKAAVKVAEC